MALYCLLPIFCIKIFYRPFFPRTDEVADLEKKHYGKIAFVIGEMIK